MANPYHLTHIFNVQIDFDRDGTFSTDIVADCISIHTTLGFGTDELMHVAEVGSMIVEVDNSSRYYSPEFTGSPYWGEKWINTPIQVLVTRATGGGALTVWRGYIQAVRPVGGENGGKRCQIICEDMLGQLRRSPITLCEQNNVTMAQALNLIGAEAYQTDRATGTITFTHTGDPDDVITVGSRTYMLKTSVSTTEYEVLIGATAAETARNLGAAINDDPDVAGGTQVIGDNTYKSTQVSAEVSAGVITLTALNRGTLGNSIALAVSAPHRDADSITVVASDGTSGTVADTHTANGVYFQVEELGGASNPAFDFNMDFTITGTGLTFYMLGRYAGGAGHTVRVQAYNWGSTSYDNVGTIAEGGSDAEFTYTLSAAHTDVDGSVRIRIYHDGIGNSAHFIRIDHMNIIADVAQTPNDIALSGSTLSGGTDGPTGLTDYATGKRTFDIPADRWSDERTNALRAWSEVVGSEFGYGWVSNEGKLTTWDKDGEFILGGLEDLGEYSSITSQLDGALDNFVINRMIVNFQPRGTSDVRVIAKANNTIGVPGKTFGTRWNRAVGYPSSGEAAALPGGTKIVRLPFVDSDTGNIVGAKDVITPRRSTDFSINDSYDLLGYDYTNYLPPFVRVSTVVTGSGVECTFSNTALDTLYVSNFQVRGTALINFDSQQIIREDVNSISLYQLSASSYNLALPSGENFAEQIAYYLIGRYSTPVYKVNSIFIQDATLTDTGGTIFALQIGERIAVTDAQVGINLDTYYVRGMDFTITGMDSSVGPNISALIRIKRIDDVTYCILDNEDFGVLDYTARLAL